MNNLSTQMSENCKSVFINHVQYIAKVIKYYK